MSFNVINIKHRDVESAWVHLVDEKGEPLFYYDMTKEEKLAHEEKVKRFKSGDLKKEPKLTAEKKPVRIKIRSPHCEAFRKALLHRYMKNQTLLQGALTQAKKSVEAGELDFDGILESTVTKLCDGVFDGAKVICDFAEDWEGFIDSDQNKVEFKPEHLLNLLTSPRNLATYTDLIRKIEEGDGFFTE